MVDIFTGFVDWALALIGVWGYPGVFIISFLGNAAIILPVPSYIVVISLGGILNPWLVGIFAGLGAAFGELTGYLVGKGGGYAAKDKYSGLLERTRRWSERHGLFPIIVLFAATPLPDDIVGIIAGVINYDIRKFLTANVIGKVISHIALALAGFYGGQLIGEWSIIFLVIFSFILAAVIWKMVTGELSARKKKQTKK